jgi:hypothetical protein
MASNNHAAMLSEVRHQFTWWIMHVAKAYSNYSTLHDEHYGSATENIKKKKLP